MSYVNLMRALSIVLFLILGNRKGALPRWRNGSHKIVMKTKFWFYPSYLEGAEKVLDTKQYYLFLDALVSYGTTGKFKIRDPLVEALFMQVKASIDAAEKRHKRAIVNGSKGGRPTKITD